MRSPRALRALALTLLAAGPLHALQRPQLTSDSVVDRIVAVIGSKVILRSHIDERILQEYPQGKGLPTTPPEKAELQRAVLETLVNEELLVQEAQRDTAIKLLDDDVTKAVDVLIKTTRGRFPNEEAWRRDIKISGFATPDEYRLWLTEQQRRQLLIKDLLAKLKGSGKLKSVSPTEGEIREYFDKNKATFPKRSESVSFRQIVIAPPSKPEAKARARALADSILIELRKGADFAAAARRLSMDPGSREAGGEIGWIRRGAGLLDPRFEEVAFSLRPGVVSDPVESSYGFHLIQVERSQPAEVQVRHILIMATVDTADADSAARAAAAVRVLLEHGAAFDSLQRIWHDKIEEKELDDIPVESLPAAYGEAITGVAAGKLTPVFR
ncbi:MAG TPA: peptidylprolyl isomerase, partial [Gemmatimonadales bacterium]|nr:peptidylprolyl isomerase [Gemmatimonadales bacterium]